MDFLNKTFAQISDLFRSLSPGARITAGLLLAVIVVSLLFLFRAGTSSGDEYLLGGHEFTSAEIGAAEAAFAKENLGKSEIVGAKIKVPRGQKMAYLAALGSNNALPADFSSALANDTSSENPFASGKSLEMRRAADKQRGLSRMISHWSGIDIASVTYDETPAGGFPRRMQRSAVVAVKPNAGAELTHEQVRAIRNTVVAAYAGLTRDSVTVTDMTTNRSYPGVAEGGVPVADDNLYAEYQLSYERQWQKKIEQHLSMIPGVVVGVNVDLDPKLLEELKSHKIDPKAITIESSETQESTSSSAPATGGRPARVPNTQVNAPASVTQTAGPQSTTERSNNQQASVASHETRLVRLVSLPPRQVQASVQVPKSYYRLVWQQNNPPQVGQEPKPPPQPDLDKIAADTKKWIEDSLAKLLPRQEAGNDPYIPVVVASFQDLPLAAIPAATTADTIFGWLAGNWQTVAMVLVGLVSLRMLRGMVRGGSANAKPADATPAVAAVGESAPETEEEPETAKLARRHFGTTGPTLRDELREIVKENPDAAATVLRSWIGDAA